MSPSPSDSGAVFDVVVIDAGGRRRTLSPGEFFALPLSDRVRHVIERTATFYKEGREVDRQAALSRLRTLRANGAAA